MWNSFNRKKKLINVLYWDLWSKNLINVFFDIWIFFLKIKRMKLNFNFNLIFKKNHSTQSKFKTMNSKFWNNLQCVIKEIKKFNIIMKLKTKNYIMKLSLHEKFIPLSILKTTFK